MSHRWQFVLGGDEEQLVELSKSFKGKEWEIRHEQSRFVLVSSKLDALDDAGKVIEKAEEWLRVLQGAAKQIGHFDKPIKIKSVEESAVDRPPTQYISVPPIPIEFQVVPPTIAIGDKVVNPADSLVDCTALAERDKAVKDVFELLTRSPTWVNLSLVYEIVRDDCGGEAGLIQRKWASKSALSRFTLTANHQDAIGHEARHSRMKTAPPKKPMAHTEAKQLIFGIVDQWIKSKR